MSVTYKKYIFLGGLVPVLPPLFLCHKTAPKFFLWGKGGAGCGKIRTKKRACRRVKKRIRFVAPGRSSDSTIRALNTKKTSGTRPEAILKTL